MLNLPRVTGWGTENWPSTVAQMGQVMYRKEQDAKDRERQQKLDQQAVEQLKFQRTMTVWDNAFKMLDIAEKYPDVAASMGKQLQPQLKAAGINLDLQAMADTKKAKEELNTLFMQDITAASEKATQNPTKENITALRQKLAKGQGRLDKDFLSIYEESLKSAVQAQAKQVEQQNKINFEKEKSKLQQDKPPSPANAETKRQNYLKRYGTPTDAIGNRLTRFQPKEKIGRIGGLLKSMEMDNSLDENQKNLIQQDVMTSLGVPLSIQSFVSLAQKQGATSSEIVDFLRKKTGKEWQE